jgi:hypothetical protein
VFHEDKPQGPVLDGVLKALPQEDIIRLRRGLKANQLKNMNAVLIQVMPFQVKQNKTNDV